MSRKDKHKQPEEQTPQPAEIESLQKQIDQLASEKQQFLEQLQRLSADYANYQKRVPRQVADSVAYEKKNIIRSLLPSLDNFEHAFAGTQSCDSPQAMQKVIEGIHLVYDHMLEALKIRGVEKIVSAGRMFNPGFHEAMMQRCEPDKPDNIVLEEFQPGYTLNGQILRPARVVVNKLPPAVPEVPQAAAEPSDQAAVPPQEEETTDTEPER